MSRPALSVLCCSCGIADSEMKKEKKLNNVVTCVVCDFAYTERIGTPISSNGIIDLRAVNAFCF